MLNEKLKTAIKRQGLQKGSQKMFHEMSYLQYTNLLFDLMFTILLFYMAN